MEGTVSYINTGTKTTSFGQKSNIMNMPNKQYDGFQINGPNERLTPATTFTTKLSQLLATTNLHALLPWNRQTMLMII